MVFESGRHGGKVDEGEVTLEARRKGNPLPFWGQIQSECGIIHHRVFSYLNAGFPLCRESILLEDWVQQRVHLILNIENKTNCAFFHAGGNPWNKVGGICLDGCDPGFLATKPGNCLLLRVDEKRPTGGDREDQTVGRVEARIWQTVLVPGFHLDLREEKGKPCFGAGKLDLAGFQCCLKACQTGLPGTVGQGR